MDTRAPTVGLPSVIDPRQTPERVAGAIKSRDGGAGVISKPRSTKKLGNAG